MKKAAALIALVALTAVVLFKITGKDHFVRTNLLGYKKDKQLEPTRLKFVQEYFVLDNLAAKLVEIGPNGEYINYLAKDFKFSSDGKSLSIVLKRASFSDGSPITANDVAASIKRATVLGTPHSNLKGLWVGSDKLKSIEDEIEGIRVIGEDRLELKLTRASKELLYFFTMTDLSILHKSQYSKEVLTAADWMDITSGPYRIGYTEQGHMSLIANPTAINYSADMPQQVTYESYKGDDVIKRLKDKSLDFGSITLVDYLNNTKTIESVKGLDVLGNRTDGIVLIALNVKSKTFANQKVRQWVQRKILEGYKVDERYKNGIAKAHQFFLPNAKGYIPNAEVLSLLKDVDTSSVPSELKDGLKIKAISGMKDYLPSDIEETLSKVLGVKVEIDFSTPSKEYFNFLGKRDFDATIIGISMSYKVLGETLNLQYLSKSPTFLDPTGKIHQLMESYQNKEDLKEEAGVIQKILEQMVRDSECVPVFYFASPFFANPGRIDVSKLNLDESVQFWRARVR